MAELPHLRISNTERSYGYTARGGGGSGEFRLPARDRARHAIKLKSELATVEQEADQRGFQQQDPRPVTYELQPNAMEVIESLERRKSGIELLSVIRKPDRIIASVRVPPGKQRILEAIFLSYETKEHWKSQRPKHQDLVESIDRLHLATQSDLWTDSVGFPDRDTPIWWEVWLYHDNTSNPDDAQRFFTDLATAAGLRVKPRRVIFPDRIVVLAYGTFTAWQTQPRLLLAVAELRKAKELASDYVDIEPEFQAEVAADIRKRVEPPEDDVPAVCLLDTGVDREHPLLEIALAESDTQAVAPEWGSNDHDQEKHGTGMAGIALYGPLTRIVLGGGPIPLRHCLESVKILPRVGQNDPDLYGDITQEAIARAESTAPERKRVGCMAVTADSRDGGLPSSWSAAIDQMCAGGPIVGEPKLMCVAAGNLRDEIASAEFEYPTLAGEKSGVEDPGQAWNAITVGAFTELVNIQDPDFEGYEPIAPSGDLSPTSRTSLAWPDDTRGGWPLKPDIVMEGGNWAETAGGNRDTPDDLGLLTTIVHSSGRLFTITRDTSPATAAAARLAALIWSQYPNLWPETVRGLMIHSARWTPAMAERFPGSAKAVIQQRLRCYGYGVPDLARALYSAENAATLLFEGKLQPYKLEGSDVKTKEMHVHELPWPRQVLEALGAEPVRMRTTLSYFIEPSPGRRGWTRRHRYASHGLRFDVKRPTETVPQFLQRISEAATEEGEDVPAASTQTQPWVVGTNGRTQGSIHSDWWEGTAADLAACGYLAIYPVTGWWRERRRLERWNNEARYSLIVTLETEAEAQLYTAIVNLATVQTEITAG